jgi:hypothetical protein
LRIVSRIQVPEEQARRQNVHVLDLSLQDLKAHIDGTQLYSHTGGGASASCPNASQVRDFEDNGRSYGF